MIKRNKKEVGSIVKKSGVSFRVWAPFADMVYLAGSFNDWQERLLVNEEDGYWSIYVQGAIPGQEYQYVIVNGDQRLIRNDPRALHFTTSAGFSVITRSSFDWENDKFEPIPINKQIIYELHIGTFNRADPSICGNFNDACDKLDYLQDLGVNMIELLPISTMMMDRGWGYAIDYIYSVESLYGGRHGFLQFVKQAHLRGMGIILDVVYNHFGPDNELDLWNFDGWSEDGKGGIYFYNDWRSETPWGSSRPDFGRPEVRQYILDNVKMWLHDCRVDGLRVDSTIFMRNVTGKNNDPVNDLPEGWSLLQQINDVAKKIKPSALIVAEDVADNDYITKPISEGGAGFNSQWALGFPWAIRQALTSNKKEYIDLSGLCGELTKHYTSGPFESVIYIDSHDTAANGAARFNEDIAPGKADSLFARQQQLMAATILLTSPGIPMLFQGEEFMTPGSFSDWRALDWTRSERFSGLVKAHKHLIALRVNAHDTTKGLIGPNINLMHVDLDNKVMAYHRWLDGGVGDDVVVIINFSNIEFASYQINFPCNGKWKVRFNSTWDGYDSSSNYQQMEDIIVNNGVATIKLPSAAALIISQD